MISIAAPTHLIRNSLSGTFCAEAMDVRIAEAVDVRDTRWEAFDAEASSEVIQC